MRSVSLTFARSNLASLLNDAMNGVPIKITRRGIPVAALVSVGDAAKIHPPQKRSFEDFLFSFPGGIEFERDHTPLRDIDL